MSTSCRRLDDVALWKILESVDAVTLQKCRRVSSKWNEEIFRLNDYTSKFKPQSLIMEIEGSKFKLSVGTPNSPPSFETDSVDSETVQRVLCHVSPPQLLMIFLNWISDYDSYDKMMRGIKKEWVSEIKDLELVCHNTEIQFSKVLLSLDKCLNLTSLSLSHYCNESISIGDVFKTFPKLRNLRIFGFNSNAGSECSSGLVFDDNAMDQLLNNQKEYRIIQSIELFNTDITVSMEVMTEALRILARLPLHSSVILNSSSFEDSSTVNLLFDNCRWDSIKELNLLTSIIRISSQFNFPIQQPSESILKGDFRFSIYETNFILKFMIG